jgi:hypothetical protein
VLCADCEAEQIAPSAIDRAALRIADILGFRSSVSRDEQPDEPCYCGSTTHSATWETGEPERETGADTGDYVCPEGLSRIEALRATVDASPQDEEADDVPF